MVHQKILYCQYCTKGFENQAGLDHHYTEEHRNISTKNLKSYSKSQSNVNENRTNRILKEEEDFIIKCNFCRKIFLRPVDLQAHMKKEHVEHTRIDIKSATQEDTCISPDFSLNLWEHTLKVMNFLYYDFHRKFREINLSTNKSIIWRNFFKWVIEFLFFPH